MNIRIVTEERHGDVPLFVQPEWQREFPWLMQGTTPREAGNFSGFSELQDAQSLNVQWRKLRHATGMHTSVLGRQVHGAGILTHGELSAGLLLTDDADGHITRTPGILLAVSVADCVPVFLVDAAHRRVAVVHAGWRGTAAGIVSACVAQLSDHVFVHLGPAICGNCYEVGPEVHSALGLAPPERNTPIDLRAVIAQQCLAHGVAAERITSSSWCTRCGDRMFFSHRGQDPERQVGVIGIR